MIKNIEIIKKQIQSAVDVYKSGDLAKAEILTRKLINNHPKAPFLYNLLGNIASGQKKIEVAKESYEKSIEVDPNFSIAYSNLGLLYFHHKSDYKKAEDLYKKSISLNTKEAEPHNNLGALYYALDKYDEAIKCYNRAIDINDKFSQPHHNIGNVYIAIGNFNEAKKHFTQSIKLNSDDARSHRSLSRLIKYKSVKEGHFKELIRAYKLTNSNNIENKINLTFALGKAYEDIKNFKESYTYYKEANTLNRKKINFSLSHEQERFKEIKNTFNIELFKKYQDSGNQSSSPIFILGMPRSGTTLIEQILSNHPKVYGADEIEFIPDLIRENFKNNINQIENFDKNNLRKIGDSYIKKISNISNNSERTTDKLPINFNWIGFIKIILPKSRIIHCYRDPKDNCLSIYKNYFAGSGIKFGYDINEIVEFYNLYQNLMDYWKKLLPSFIFNIKYENLISNTEVEIKNLLKFCDLPWSVNCLNFHKNKKPIKTSSDVQARNKIYNTSVDSWKNYDKYLSKYFNKLS